MYTRLNRPQETPDYIWLIPLLTTDNSALGCGGACGGPKLNFSSNLGLWNVEKKLISYLIMLPFQFHVQLCIIVLCVCVHTLGIEAHCNGCCKDKLEFNSWVMTHVHVKIASCMKLSCIFESFASYVDQHATIGIYA